MKRIRQKIAIIYYLFKNISFADIVRTIKTTLFRNDLIYVFSIDTNQLIKETDNDVFTKCKSNEIEIRKGHVDELDEYCKKCNQRAWEYQCHKFDDVKDFFIARNDDTIMCITWIYKKGDPNRFLIMGDKQALLQYGLTLPEFRGCGLLPAVLKAIAKYLKNQGCEKVYGLIHHKNSSSIKGTTKAGFVKVGQLHLIKIFGIQISRKLDVSKLE